MARPPTKNPRLADRDYEMFHHVMRYHMTTREVLHRLFFSDAEENAVTKVTSRLVRHGYFNRYELYPPRTYFVLGSLAASLMGISPKKTKEFGPQALIREFATLAYCCLAEQPRKRLMVRELQEHHSCYLQRNLDSSHYYLDNDGQTTRLAHIRVDYGGPPDHIVRKCKQDIDDRYAQESFRQLIDAGGFLVAIVTAREEKAAAIHEALKRHDWKNTRFRIEVVPDLVHLITRFEGV
jgi:hypothetical protein